MYKTKGIFFQSVTEQEKPRKLFLCFRRCCHLSQKNAFRLMRNCVFFDLFPRAAESEGGCFLGLCEHAVKGPKGRTKEETTKRHQNLKEQNKIFKYIFYCMR